MSQMSDTEKQFQEALRYVERKFKREVESEVMSDKPESRDLLYCICSDPENCRGPVPRALCRRIYGVPGKGKEPQDMVSKFNEMRECLGVLTAMVRQDFGNVDPRYMKIIMRCEKVIYSEQFSVKTETGVE